MPTKLTALLAGFFAGFLVPYLALAAAVAAFQYQDASGHISMPTWLIPVQFLLFVTMPVLAGFVAAMVANVQPLLHGLFVGVLGALAFSALLAMNSFATIVLSWLVCISGGAAGAWLHARRRRL